ncbi:hypothetical protein GUJ93_ZPchr0013g35901 [Zizania palustris]|uniref:Uncharacterized protein n=1 Tax=Zizania palustris TaxID=103762 RepID=A0A8J5XA78_ZIZPA|nr:hypothetical protein GUJ93_ZPchr0013g35901 [Zizania palustris]
MRERSDRRKTFGQTGSVKGGASKGGFDGSFEGGSKGPRGILWPDCRSDQGASLGQTESTFRNFCCFAFCLLLVEVLFNVEVPAQSVQGIRVFYSKDVQYYPIICSKPHVA